MKIEKTYNDWYLKVAGKLSGNGIWLRGQELNTLPLSEFGKRGFRVLITRLSTYKDTTDSFTHQLLYQIAKNIEGIFPDMAFLPPFSDIKFFDTDNIPWMLPIKTKFHPTSYDLIGISNSIVQEIVNIPTMFLKSGIPIYKSKRIHNENIPLIILGGANAVNSSLLFTDDPIVDGIFIGEDTESIRKIFEICRDGKQNKKSKTEILNILEGLDGFFQPEKIYNSNIKISRKISQNPEQLRDAPVLYSNDASSGFLRISEGCPYFCSFCSESWNRKPYIEETTESLIEAALELKSNCGFSNIDLFSFNFNIHSELYGILWKLSDVFANTGVKSQRFDHIAQNPDMLKLLQVIGKSSITCGLEGISERLRKYLHKNLETSTLIKSIEYLFLSHIRELKIFLIATGKENEEDFQDFKKLLENIQSILYGIKNKKRIIFSITPLVRFPLTPLEFDDAQDREVLKKITDTISNLVMEYGFEARSAADLNDYYISQILVRASNQGILKALIQTIKKTNFIYYTIFTDKFVKEFITEIATSGIDPNSLLKGYNIEERKEKPWHVFDTGVNEKYLINTYIECSEFEESSPCFGTKKCNGCDGCPDKTFIKKITHSIQQKGYSPDELHRKIVNRRNNLTTLNFIIKTGPATKGIPGEMTGIALARALMLSDKELIPHYQSYQSSFWDAENKGAWITGDNIISLNWTKASENILIEKLMENDFINLVNLHLTPEWGKLKGLSNNVLQKISLKITEFERFNPQEYLQTQHLKYTQRKNQDGGFIYEFSKDSLKKDIIQFLETKFSEIHLIPGKKFLFSDFQKKCFNKTNFQKICIISTFN